MKNTSIDMTQKEVSHALIEPSKKTYEVKEIQPPANYHFQ